MHGMPLRRVVLAHLIIAAILTGSLVDTVTGGEHWPFSSYPMFARQHRMQQYTRRRLYGVTAETPPREIPLREQRFLAPMDISRMGVALERMERTRSRTWRLPAAAATVLRRYERLRIEGRHEGPPLREVRVYKVAWDMNESASNLDTPTKKVLLASSADVQAKRR